MKKLIEEKLGNEYGTVIIDDNSRKIKKSFKKQLKHLQPKSISQTKPFLMTFYFQIMQLLYFQIMQLLYFQICERGERRKSIDDDSCLYQEE
jgi:hypothetical protein